MAHWLKPKESISDGEVATGLRMLLFSGSFGQIMVSLTGGAFLVAFALSLGASNKVIGMLAAIGPLAQMVQIPSVLLVERTRARKALVVVGAVCVRLGWVVIALIPWLAPEAMRLPLFLICLLVLSGFGSMVACAFNSWVRDLVPEEQMGRYFAKRMAITVAVGAVLSLAAGVGLDVFKDHVSDELSGYSILFLAGAAFGLIGITFLVRTPEPLMPPAPKLGLRAILSEPLKDRNYRQLLRFLGAWSFATNFAGPFFMVYMRQELELSMTWILSLVVLSQLVNVVFFKLWGRLADRYSNKSVLAFSGPLFILTFLMWPFTTMPETHALTIPLLVLIHILAGMSTAGVLLCSNNLALKMAPQGRSTSYLATNALLSGVAAMLAPVIAGFAADWFASQELNFTIRWTSMAASGTSEFEVPAFSLRNLDFLFVLSFPMGLYSLHRLLALKEEGTVDDKVIRAEFYAEVRRAARQISSVAGMRDLMFFPLSKLKETLQPSRGDPGRPAPSGDDEEIP